MRRILLLVLLALALPTVALADTFSFTTGNFVEGSVTYGFESPFQVQLFGTMNKVILSTDICTFNEFDNICTFSSGTLFSPTAFGGSRLSLVNGKIRITTTNGGASGTATIFANLTSFLGQDDGFTKFQFSWANIKLTGGNAEVVQTPEPDALGLLGTGLIGLVAMVGVGRKFKLPT